MEPREQGLNVVLRVGEVPNSGIMSAARISVVYIQDSVICISNHLNTEIINWWWWNLFTKGERINKLKKGKGKEGYLGEGEYT